MNNRLKDSYKSKYELLAPAGSFEALKAAVNAGCDAVYCGGNMFGARAFANNFGTEELIEAIDYCHLFGKSLYLTVNTLLKNNEIEDELYEYIRPLYEAGLDAVIVQDMGVLRFIHKNFPDLDIHASTQMTILGANFANELKRLGVKRIVTPRELHLNEINKIYRDTNLEIESFVHGALCYCYSGQCLMSSLIGQRSGNRGKCAQPCRLPYSVNTDRTQEYFLSPKDLCSLNILPDILESGVFSLKIEGRMKNPEYVAVVVSIYRKYIDMYEQNKREGYKVASEDMDKLIDIYNRGGFTEGFYHRQNSKDIIYTKRPNHLGTKAGRIQKISGNNIYFDNIIDLNKNDVLEFRLKNKEYISFNLGADYKKSSHCVGYLHKKNVKNIKDLYNTDIYRTKNNLLSIETSEKYLKDNLYNNKLKLDGCIAIKRDENITFKVSLGDIEYMNTFDKPSIALKQAIDKDAVKKQLSKTGNDIFDFNNIEIILDDGLFVPIGVLNNIRRDVLDGFKNCYLDTFKRSLTNDVSECSINSNPLNHCNDRVYTALVTNNSQLQEVLEFDDVKAVYVEQGFNSYECLENMCQKIISKNKEAYLVLPHITRAVFERELNKNMNFYENNKYSGYMFRSFETFFMFKSHALLSKKVVFDSHIYTFNNYSYDYYKELGADVLTSSYEHSLKELESMNTDSMEVNLYGYIPVMISANCINKTISKCQENFKQSSNASIVVLNDRLNNQFKILPNCRNCYNIIYNNVPLSLYDEVDTLSGIGYSRFRLNFTLEDADETRRILECYINNNRLFMPASYTKGHWKRGV